MEILEQNFVINKQLNIKTKQIDEDTVAFKAKLITSLACSNGVDEKVEESEGISSKENIKNSILKNTLPNNNSFFILKDPEFLELTRLYGHPYSILEDTEFVNKKDVYSEMKILMELNQIKFDEVNDDMLDQIIFVDLSSHTIFEFLSKKILNVAKSTERLELNEANYKNYRSLITELIDKKRLTLLTDSRDRIFKTMYDSSMEYVDGMINFTDEEFEKILANTEIKDQGFGRVYIDYFSFVKKFEKADIFNISKNLKTDAEKESDYERDHPEDEF